MTKTTKEVMDLIEVALKATVSGQIELKDIKDIDLATDITVDVRRLLAKERNIIINHKDGKPFDVAWKDGKPSTEPAPVKPVVVVLPTNHEEHEFILPKFSKTEIIPMLRCAKDWVNWKSVNIRKVGPKGSGKTESTFIECKEAGFDHVYRITGKPGMKPSVFLGEKRIVIDEATKQNKIVYMRGIFEQAMTHGLKKDKDGNVELDVEGNVIVISAPGTLFIDEYASIPESTNIALNQIMEIPKRPGQSRTLNLDDDGGRLVKGHPGFCIILAGNTRGKGLQSSWEQGYTAQDIRQDDSTLDRITATFIYGYNLIAEEMIVKKKLVDMSLVKKFLDFRDKARKSYKESQGGEGVGTLLSTRNIVQICDTAVLYRECGLTKYLPLAIHRVLLSGIDEGEVNVWCEWVNLMTGIDPRTDPDFKEKDQWRP